MNDRQAATKLLASLTIEPQRTLSDRRRGRLREPHLKLRTRPHEAAYRRRLNNWPTVPYAHEKTYRLLPRLHPDPNRWLAAARLVRPLHLASVPAKHLLQCS